MAAPGTSGARFDALIADLEAALAEIAALTEGEQARWKRGRPGKWNAGQHTDHVVTVMEHTAADFVAAEPALRDGSLAPPAPRGGLERLWVSTLFRGWMPRGGRTVKRAEPEGYPDRAQVLERGRQAIERHRELGARLTPDERDRLWIANMFMPKWRYTLPEMVRVHAVHVRHHAKQIAEAMGARTR